VRFRLLRFFSVAAAVAFLAIGLGLYFLFRAHEFNTLVRLQEAQNVALARALANEVWAGFGPYVRDADKFDPAELRTGAIAIRLDLDVARFARGLPVHKVKIYNLAGLTVYSSEAAQIGESRADNVGFRRAVDRGLPASKLSFRDTFGAFSGEKSSVHLVETYVPIVTPSSGTTEGVFEIYTEVNAGVREIEVSTTWLGSVLVAGLGILYGILFFVVRRSSAIIALQYRELDEREARLLAARNQADAANRAKSEFLAIVSHDLRTPLNAIIGFSQMILGNARAAPAGDKSREYVAGILKSGESLLSMIDDILDFSAIDSGTMRLDVAPVDTAALVAGCVKRLTRDAEKGEVTVDTRLAPDLPRLNGDARRLAHAFAHLLSNAIKFTPAGGRVLLTAEPDERGGFIFSVRDTGVGMDAAGVQRALQPFGRLTSPFVRTREATGLGLSLAKSIVEMHGGRLDIDSAPGRGTTVTARFPPERTIR
jgi:signal transduction histidine kinase